MRLLATFYDDRYINIPADTICAENGIIMAYRANAKTQQNDLVAAIDMGSIKACWLSEENDKAKER